MQRLAAVAVSALLVAAPAQAEIKLGFVTALSGPAAALGIPYANGMKAAQKFKTKIGNETVTIIQLDDGSDPAASTRNAPPQPRSG